MPRLWLLAGLLVWVAACYAPALTGPYQFDDRIGVAIDPAAASLSAWMQAPTSHVRPLSKASFALSHTLGEWLGHVPAGHRAVNLVIHFATIAVLWRLGLQLGRACLPRLSERDVELGAGIGAALFGLHPLATEAVSYISGRSMSLGTVLAGASLVAWIHGRRVGSRRWGALSLGLAALAALGRETVVFSLPLVVIAWALLGVVPTSGRAGRPGAALRLALPFGALAAAALIWLLWHDRYAALLRLSWWIAQVRSGDASLLAALGYFGAAASLWRYPSIDPEVGVTFGTAARALGSAAVAAALWCAWRLRHRQPQWLLAAVWVLAWLLPLYAWPLRHDVVAERHFYPALWGASWALGVSLVPLVRSPIPARRGLARGVLAALLLALSTLTLVRNHDYRSEVSLWEAARRGAPQRLRVLNNLGVAYMEAGRWDEAQAVLMRAYRLAPHDREVPWNLAAAQRRDLGVLRAPALMEWPAVDSAAGAAAATRHRTNPQRCTAPIAPRATNE